LQVFNLHNEFRFYDFGCFGNPICLTRQQNEKYYFSQHAGSFFTRKISDFKVNTSSRFGEILLLNQNQPFTKKRKFFETLAITTR